MPKIHLAISTCPNDTFAFHAILNNKIDSGGLEFQPDLLDIQQLNDGLFSGRFDVAKASFHAAALLTDSTIVLPSGSAIGFGVGPLLLRRSGLAPDDTPDKTGPRPWTVLCPGEHTTATMLLRIFYADAIAAGGLQIRHTLFSDIMPQLENGSADFGVCIHEGRFTYQAAGLDCVEDLGRRWETATDRPLPLGGILARRSLPLSTVTDIQECIQRSIHYARQHPGEALETMRAYAQEFSDEVLMRHVELYVNDWTVDLGIDGAAALRSLSQQARQCGIVGSETPDLEVFCG